MVLYALPDHQRVPRDEELPVTGHWEIIICPICGDTIHRHYSEPLQMRGRVSSAFYASAGAAFVHMIEEAEVAYRREIDTAETACDDHMRAHHPRRLALWERFHWDFLLNRPWPWSKKPEFDEDFDYTERPA